MGRRHHCRNCGKLICGDCSRFEGVGVLRSFTSSISGSGGEGSEGERVRKCVNCFDFSKKS